MSFSQEVKDELLEVVLGARHCQLAELAALISMSGHVYTSRYGKHCIRLQAENGTVIKKCLLLIRKCFGYEADVTVRYNRAKDNTIFFLTVMDSETAIKILQATRIMDSDGSMMRDMSLTNTVGIANLCCKRSYLRGAFIACGSISDPKRSYHFEIAVPSLKKARQIIDALKPFELGARIIERRKYYVVYLKESEQISDMLNVIGAHRSLLNFENVRVYKDVANSVNRQHNCDMANMKKTIDSAQKQIRDIKYIKEKIGFEGLDKGLADIARIRLENDILPLKDLGELLDPPVGKSGVNHRLRKLSEIADDLREKEAKEGKL